MANFFKKLFGKSETKVESKGEYSIEFTDETGSVQVVITSASTDNDTSVTITNIKLIVEQHSKKLKAEIIQ